jgi:hypothetical protein
MKHKNGFIKNGPSTSEMHLNNLVRILFVQECFFNNLFAILKKNQKDFEQYEDTPLLQAIYTYICYIVLNVFGWLRDALRRTGIEKRKGTADPNPPVCVFF